MFLRHITYCQREVFYEGEYEKIDELSNFKCNPASHINKIRDTPIELGSRDSFRDLKFRPEQQWYSYYIVQLTNSYHLQNA